MKKFLLFCLPIFLILSANSKDFGNKNSSRRYYSKGFDSKSLSRKYYSNSKDFDNKNSSRKSSSSCLCNNEDPSNAYYVRGNVAFPVYSRLRYGTHEQNEKFKIFPLAAVGKHLNRNFSIEIEGIHRETSIERDYGAGGVIVGELKSSGALLNLLIHSPQKLCVSRIEPFLGVGVGYSHNKSGNKRQISIVGGETTEGESSNALIYQAIVGFNYNITSRLSAVFDARYIYISRFKYKNMEPNYTFDARANAWAFVLTSGLKILI
jgi:opacity protein-like surface antigen